MSKNSDQIEHKDIDNNARVTIGDHVVIYLRGKRRTWTADFNYVDAQGVRRHGRRSLGTRNRRAAETKAWDLEDKLAAGELKPSAPPETPKAIDDAITEFISSVRAEGRSRKTLVKYDGELQNFATYAAEQHKIHAMPLLTLVLFDKYKAHRRDVDGLDAYTVYNHTIILKQWLKWCRKRGMLAVNPLAEIELRMPRRRRHPAATVDQVNAILGRSDGQMLALFALLAFTGFRVGEAVALRPTDVDLAGGIIRIRARDGWGPKTEGSERDVPIHPRLSALLSTIRKGRGGWFFNAPPSHRFPNGDHHLNPREVNERFQKVARACGFAVGRNERALTLHALRRFFKTFCLDAGVPKPMVDAWMGHRRQSDMDVFYYDPKKSKEWMARVPFGESNDSEIQRALAVGTVAKIQTPNNTETQS